MKITEIKLHLPMTKPNQPAYQKGVHILCESYTETENTLQDCKELRTQWIQWIDELGLHTVGEVFHNFPNGGFTGVICLTESHISIHTWPEYNYFTFDVFLSNYEQNNDQKGEELLQRTLNLLKSTTYNLTRVQR